MLLSFGIYMFFDRSIPASAGSLLLEQEMSGLAMSRYRGRGFKRLVLGLSALVTTALLAVALPVAASANTIPVSDAYGFTVRTSAGTEWVGTKFVGVNKILAVCDQPSKALNGGQTFYTVDTLAELGPVKSLIAEYVLNKYLGLRGKINGAAVRIDLNTLAGNRQDVRRWIRALPIEVRAKVVALSRKHLANGRRYHGPYSVSFALSSQPKVGEHATATFKVVSKSTNRGVPGETVSLSSPNMFVPATIRTNSAGVASADVVVTDVGDPVIDATSLLAPTQMLVGSVPPNEQQLKAAKPSVPYTAKVTYSQVVNAPTVSYVCDSVCAGNPPVTVKGCNESTGAVMQYMVFDDAVLAVAPEIQPGQCTETVFNALDGHHITVGYRYMVNGKWTATVTFPGELVIDCPPQPAVTVNLTYDCAANNAIVVVSMPASPTRPTAIFIDGKQAVLAGPGEVATKTFTAKCGNGTVFQVQGAIQRTNTQFNMGPIIPVTIT